MARPLPIEGPELWYHVTWRGEVREQPQLRAWRERPRVEQIVRVVEGLKKERWEAGGLDYAAVQRMTRRLRTDKALATRARQAERELLNVET